MKEKKIFYGWWVLAASFVIVFIYSAVGYYAFQFIWEEIRADYDWSMGTLTASFTIVYATLALSSPITGRIIGHYGPRKTIAGGAFIVGLGLCMLSQTTSLWYFWLCHILIGMGMAASGFMPTSIAISNWFSKRRGFVLGLTMTGIGVGGFIIGPLLQNVLLPKLGWSDTYYILAATIWIVVIPLALLVMRDKPQDMGLFPDGVATAEEVILPKSSATGHVSWTRPMALKTVAFWIIAIAFCLQSFGNTGTVQNQTRHLKTVFAEGSFVWKQLGTIVGTVAIGSTAGKLFFGWLADKIGPQITSMACIACSLVAVTLLINITETSSTSIIWVYSIFMGLSMGGWASNTPMLISNYFGLKHYGAIYGAANLFIMMGTAFGPLIAGFIYDAVDTYRPVHIYALILSTIALTAIAFLRAPKEKKTIST
ncbi:MAG: MFS transporter [Chloroflexi bacterium]|jgi:MFS family permease|nr:MFS transporter [Chloroflexota bacterium]MBT7080802.1 MFS transporter [Chloroflexota bacterium]MBT7289958.1 MFS transporter [Chloroflexota bacterium]